MHTQLDRSPALSSSLLRDRRIAVPEWLLWSAVLFLASLALGLLAFSQDAYGLRTEVQTREGNPPPAASVPQVFQQVEVVIHDQVAATRTFYQFSNQSSQELELGCALELQPGEQVDGFSYWNGEERIVGEVLEKQAAREVYEELTGVRRDPGLLEQEGNFFRFRVYPVAPAELKPIEVRTLQALEIRRGVVEYRIPRANLPAPGVLFSLILELTDDLPIEELEVLDGATEGLAAARVTRQGPRARQLKLEAIEAPDFQDDLIIRYRLASQDHSLRFVANRTPGAEGTFMLLFSPKELVATTEVLGRDILFVVDCSGSMDGEPITRTKAALRSILGQLRPVDRFDLIAFSNDAVPMFFKLREHSPEAVQDALTALEAVDKTSCHGGTAINKALQAALSELQTPSPGRTRAVIFLTDGQGDQPPEQTLALVRQQGAGIRIYSIGIGNNVNRPFLERLARHNRGEATFIESPSRINADMEALYARIAMPLLTDLQLEWEGVHVHTAYPQQLPDLYRDSQVLVYGRFRETGAGRVRLRGLMGQTPREYSLDVVLPAEEPRYAYLEKLWAARRVEQLLDLNQEQASEELVREVTRLGIVHNLVTPYTSFLAVPESLKTAEVKERIRLGQQGYDKQLVDSLEGIRLSQQAIPPGDPVLTVDAPADARKVVAYFPFGLVKRLAWDPYRNLWSVRFLVPRDVEDGIYLIRVAIHQRDGQVQWKQIEYIIDATAPEFLANLPEEAVAGQPLRIEVDPFEQVRRVTARLLDVTSTRPVQVDLPLDLETGRYAGELTLPADLAPGAYLIRIVVRDRAHNRFESDFPLTVKEFACDQ